MYTSDAACSLIALVSIAGTLFCISRFHLTKPTDVPSPRRSPPPEKDIDAARLDFSRVEVSRIFIHPIKSCRGTAVSEAAYTGDGLENDRRFAIIDASTHRVVTAREQHHMVLIHPQVHEDAAHPDGGYLLVSFPPSSPCAPFAVPLRPAAQTLLGWKMVDDIALWGQTVDGYICQALPGAPDTDPHAPSAVLSAFLGRAVHLVYKGPRPRPCPPTYEFPALNATAVYQDGYPLLVASEESLAAVQDRVRACAADGGKSRGGVGLGVQEKWREEELAMERFRPNIVVRGAGVPWAEDMWETIAIGARPVSTISLVSKCARCLLPNVDTETGAQDKAVPYKVLMTFRTGKDPARMGKACFGCNGVPSGAGVVHVGDSVRIVKLAG